MARRVNIIVGLAIAVVLVVAIGALVLMGQPPAGNTGALRALVHDSDGVVHELPLATDAEAAITTSRGTNVVAVQDGAVFVRDADCDNHDCMRQGKLSAPGGQIICLPHELWIEVVADGDAAGQMNVDAVAGDGTGDFDAIAR